MRIRPGLEDELSIPFAAALKDMLRAIATLLIDNDQDDCFLVALSLTNLCLVLECQQSLSWVGDMTQTGARLLMEILHKPLLTGQDQALWEEGNRIAAFGLALLTRHQQARSKLIHDFLPTLISLVQSGDSEFALHGMVCLEIMLNDDADDVYVQGFADAQISASGLIKSLCVRVLNNVATYPLPNIMALVSIFNTLSHRAPLRSNMLENSGMHILKELLHSSYDTVVSEIGVYQEDTIKTKVNPQDPIYRWQKSIPPHK